MDSHPFFTNLLLHSDTELSTILGKEITDRKTIHEWPLSCVQQLTLADGKKLAYKSQLPPTIEHLFYQSASSPLLAGYQYLGTSGDCETMLIDWIDAPLLSNTAPDPRELIKHGERITGSIREINIKVPVYLDLGSEDAWSSAVTITLNKLAKLIMNRKFRLIDQGAPQKIETWSEQKPVLESIITTSCLAHGDLKADQIFITSGGYKVIDWQRPLIAPGGIDLVSLLVEQGIDPSLAAGREIIQIFWFVRLHWAVKSQHDLFPLQRWPIFDQWAREAISHLLTE